MGGHLCACTVTPVALAAGLTVLLLGFGTPLLAFRDGAPACAAAAPRANLDFTLRDLDGRSVSLRSFAGKVLLLDFWASWCGPCRVEAPALVDLAAREAPKGLVVAGVMVQDEFANAKGFAREMRLNYPVLDGTGRADLEKNFGPFDGLPTTYLIARDGRICQKHIGLPPLPAGAHDLSAATRTALGREVASLLGGG